MQLATTTPLADDLLSTPMALETRQHARQDETQAPAWFMIGEDELEDEQFLDDEEDDDFLEDDDDDDFLEDDDEDEDDEYLDDDEDDDDDFLDDDEDEEV